MSPDYVFGGQRIPAVNASASRDGALTHISLVNLDPSKTVTVRTNLGNIGFTTVTGQVLTSAKFTDINTFDKPNVVKPAVFTGAKKEGNDLVVEMPPMSIVVLELK
jgi:alpha-N-arabinofuranosidase